MLGWKSSSHQAGEQVKNETSKSFLGGVISNSDEILLHCLTRVRVRGHTFKDKYNYQRLQIFSKTIEPSLLIDNMYPLLLFNTVIFKNCYVYFFVMKERIFKIWYVLWLFSQEKTLI